VKLTATAAAEAVVRKVAEGRQDLLMVLGDGCCDSTAPFLFDGYLPEPDAIPIGEVAGVPVLAHRWLADLYADDDELVVDVEQDSPNDSLSLESDYDCRLALRVADRSTDGTGPAKPGR
jgi:uncharacterized protein (DUF779 family)